MSSDTIGKILGTIGALAGLGMVGAALVTRREATASNPAKSKSKIGGRMPKSIADAKRMIIAAGGEWDDSEATGKEEDRSWGGGGWTEGQMIAVVRVPPGQISVFDGTHYAYLHDWEDIKTLFLTGWEPCSCPECEGKHNPSRGGSKKTAFPAYIEPDERYEVKFTCWDGVKDMAKVRKALRAVGIPEDEMFYIRASREVGHGYWVVYIKFQELIDLMEIAPDLNMDAISTAMGLGWADYSERKRERGKK